jgi:drug/metabolite transporter (DMT)-like permease
MFYAFLATGISALTLVLQKFILSRLKIEFRLFNAIGFISLALAAFIWTMANHSLPSANFFSTPILILLLILLLVVFVWNYLFAYALCKESMAESELIIMMQPFFTVLLAYAVLPSERSLTIFLPAIFAGLILVWANFKKHHLAFDQMEKFLLFAVFLMAIDTIIIKEILSLYSISAESLYFLRSSLVAIPMIAVVFLFKVPIKINLKNLLWIVLSAVLATGQFVFFYRAYLAIGVTQTILISLLAPVIVFLLSTYILKEKIAWKLWLALILIIMCIALVQFKII